MKDFETLLAGSAKAHGHMCPGQVLGVRMAMLGCGLIGLDEPSFLPQIKKLIVYVEIDRCATDAIAFVTGAKLGRRSLKFIDNGIMAATFVNLETGLAYRIRATESARHLTHEYSSDMQDERGRQLEAYKVMPNELLFEIEKVLVSVRASDMPGPTRFKARCQKCGVTVRDKREVYLNNRVMCRPCAHGSYYDPIRKTGTE